MPRGHVLVLDDEPTILTTLQKALTLEGYEVEVVGDSELIAKQVQGSYKVRHEAMRPLHRQALDALGRFADWSIRTVPRAQNARADALVNADLDGRAAGRRSAQRLG